MGVCAVFMLLVWLSVIAIRTIKLCITSREYYYTMQQKKHYITRHYNYTYSYYGMYYAMLLVLCVSTVVIGITVLL